MNWFTLKYMRWKNTSNYWKRKQFKNTTVEKIFYRIMPTNTYVGYLHNNLKIYKAMKQHPESKILKKMFINGYIRMFSTKSKWKFARQIYKKLKEEINEIDNKEMIK